MTLPRCWLPTKFASTITRCRPQKNMKSQLHRKVTYFRQSNWKFCSRLVFGLLVQRICKNKAAGGVDMADRFCRYPRKLWWYPPQTFHACQWNHHDLLCGHPLARNRRSTDLVRMSRGSRDMNTIFVTFLSTVRNVAVTKWSYYYRPWSHAYDGKISWVAKSRQPE